MDTRTLIEASAEVVTITRLKAGDVYKRLDTGAYAASNLVFGVVQTAMNNGTDSAITAIEIVPGYQTATVANKVFASGTNVALFAATPEEYEAHCAAIMREIDQSISAKRKAVEDAEALRRLCVSGLQRALRGQLTAPQTTLGIVEAQTVEDTDD